MNHYTKSIITVCLTILIATFSLQAGEIHDAAAAGDLEKVKSLLEADPTLLESKKSKVNLWFRPLHSACYAGQVAVANYLIDRGADVNARDRFKMTSLARACRFENPDLTLVQRLIDEGADINMIKKDRSSPLHWAAFSGGVEVAKLLIDQGADVNAMSRYNGVTPLHRAAQMDNFKVAKLLIEHGADVNRYDQYNGPIKSGEITGTILQAAIDYGSKEDVAKLLVKSGAILNKRDLNNNTELHLAAMKGYADLTLELIKHGADINAANEHKRTALYYAAKHGYRSVVDALIAGGANKNTMAQTNYGKAPQLTAALKEGEAWLWWMEEGYVVKTKNHLLLFNPYYIGNTPEKGLANGHLNPKELADQNITVLITEAEHYLVGRTEAAVELSNRLPDVDFVLSCMPAANKIDDLNTVPYRLASPNESFSMGGIQVHTIPATGGGLGYLVVVDGIKIFHAGVHVTDTKAPNVATFRKEIDYLKPYGPIDIALLPVWGHNPRVGTAYEPFLYLLDQLSPKAIYLSKGNNFDQYKKCTEVLSARTIPVFYPEGGKGKGERFHYLRE